MVPKHLAVQYGQSVELSRGGPSHARHICLDAADPWGSRPKDLMMEGPHGQATAAILSLPEGEKGVVVLRAAAGEKRLYSWGEPFEVLTYDSYARNGEEGARRSVERRRVERLPEAARERYGEEIAKQFRELRLRTTRGEWPQAHSLNFGREEMAATYVIYSGGETSFTPEGYRRAGYRAWPHAHGFLHRIAEGVIQPARPIKAKLVEKAANPPWPEKRGELWMVERARRALGLKAKPADNASWTDLRWRVIELAVELGWKPWETAGDDDSIAT